MAGDQASMTLAIAKKQAPDSTSIAKRDGARSALTNSPQRGGSFPVPFIQRKPTCACGGGCPRCNPEHPIADNSETVPQTVQEALRSPSQPLDTATRGLMESRFSHDFSHVRIHNDGRAQESARTIDALAYAVGHHIVFGRGQYVPNTSTGRRLLAHVLAHVVQQDMLTPKARCSPYSQPGDSWERYADG